MNCEEHNWNGGVKSNRNISRKDAKAQRSENQEYF